MSNDSGTWPLTHDDAPDLEIGERFGKWIANEVATALDRAVIRPYASPFYEGRSLVLAASASPLSLLSYHAGRVRALVSSTDGIVYIGSLSQLASGNGYELTTSPLEIKTVEEVFVVSVGGGTVSVWAEYAVQ